VRQGRRKWPLGRARHSASPKSGRRPDVSESGDVLGTASTCRRSLVRSSGSPLSSLFVRARRRELRPSGTAKLRPRRMAKLAGGKARRCASRGQCRPIGDATAVTAMQPPERRCYRHNSTGGDGGRGPRGNLSHTSRCLQKRARPCAPGDEAALMSGRGGGCDPSRAPAPGRSVGGGREVPLGRAPEAALQTAVLGGSMIRYFHAKKWDNLGCV
jgi:hypothetical protein